METCQCGKIELLKNIRYDEDGNATCRECVSELQTEYVADKAIKAANKNLN